MKREVAIEKIYAEREKFIIIGLTGRTGAGCTTVSNILGTEKFSDLNLREPKTTGFETNEQRKYQIVYNYIEQHWNSFFRISMTDVIFSFIIQFEYEVLFEELNKIIGENLSEKIKNELEQKYSNIAAEYSYLHEEVSKIYKENSVLNRANKNDLSIAYDILIRLGSIQSKFRRIMNNNIYIIEDSNTQVNTFTHCLQEFGNRIRNHGDITARNDFNGTHMFALASRANDFIKAVQAMNKANKNPTFISLDAIRSPYEATYFQDRYSSFYLVAVSTDDEERVRRLGEKLSREQIKALDKKEYPRKLKGESKFTNQDIGACVQLADIYLYNPYESTKEKYFVTESLIKYITLIKHPGLITPTSVERCMQIAYNAKLNSGCLSRQVGAVITDSHFSIKAVGWNSVAEGQVPCNLRNAENYLVNKDRDSFSTFEIEDNEFVEHSNRSTITPLSKLKNS